MKVLQKTILFLALCLAGTVSSFAQTQPHNLTQEEKALMPAYLESFKNQAKGTNAFYTSPPASPIRALAEWEEIDGLLVCWTTYLPTVREIIKWARLETTVWVVCSDSNAVKTSLTSNNIPLGNVKYLQVAFNSVWARDYGQWNVYTNDVDSLYLIDWIYNRPRPDDNAIPEYLANAANIPMFQLTQSPYDLIHTGGNYMVDGNGSAFSSNLILDENPTKTQAQIDTIMKKFMGISRYVHMPTLPYDGIHHIDMHLKLLDEETLMWGEYPTGVADGPQIEANLQYVQSNYPSVFGTPYKIVHIPQPPELYQGNLYYPDDNGAYLTYTNAVFVNKTVLVTQYRPEFDTIAKRIWETALPGYKIVFIDCNNIIQASGALHCITKEIGAANPLLITHQPLDDTYNVSTPYTVNAWIKHRSGIASATVYYRTDTLQPFQQTSMSLTNAATDTWTGNIPPQASGTRVYYYIEATSNSGKTQVRPMPAPLGYWDFDVLGTVSVSAAPSVLEIRMYPNPAKGIVCVDLKSGFGKQSTATITDQFGRKVSAFAPGILDTGSPKLFFDCSNLAAGVYTILISDGMKTVAEKLFVK